MMVYRISKILNTLLLSTWMLVLGAINNCQEFQVREFIVGYASYFAVVSQSCEHKLSKI